MVLENRCATGAVLSLYEGAIESLECAERAFHARGRGAAEEYHRQLTASQLVTHQLIGSLNLRQGGETALQLFRVYDFINYQLIRANILKEIEGVREARTLFCDLRGKAAEELLEEEPE